MMSRDDKNAVPKYLDQYLNIPQFATYRAYERFGWDLFFIRRSERLVVLVHNSTNKMGVIEKDGTFNTDCVIKLRRN